MVLDGHDSVAVLGAGSMGHGIAEVTALAGYDVTIRDIDVDVLEEGYEEIEWSLEKLADKGMLDQSPADVLDRIDTETELAPAVETADIVIEAAPEKMALKREIFADLDEHAPDHAILASNTSSLSITEIASSTDRPGRVCGLHFFNPPVKMDLVEVIYGDETTEETAETAHAFVEDVGKTPIYVRKDIRGFVVNSVLDPFVTEPMWMVSAGEADVRQADAAMVYQRGYPMGPFELADMTGIDISYHVREETGQPIPSVMAEKVEAGDLGTKTGKGFYDYEDGDGADYDAGEGDDFDTLRVEARIINQAAELIETDVSTAEEIDTGMRLGTGFPEGPCRRGDKLGLDTVLEKLEALHEETGKDRFEPSAYLRRLVEEGRTGEAAGEGFYTYGGDGGDREYRNITVELSDNGLLTVELDRPERLNAINPDLLAEIDHLLETIDVADVRCVVFEGAGDRAFSAGADVAAVRDAEPHELSDTGVIERVDEFERPTLAKIDGLCLGGGHELALACDLRVATTDSTFGFPEIDLGLIPGGGGTQRTIRLLGEARAKELIFRGNRIPASRAEEWGLINRAVDPEAFDDVVDEFVDDIVSGPPVALEYAKQVMNDGADGDLDAGLRMESQAFGLLLTTDDAEEGTAAFVEDREPEFRGT